MNALWVFSLLSPVRVQHGLFLTFIDPPPQMAAILVLQQMKLPAVIRLYHRRAVTEQGKLQHESQCCVLQEDKAGQGVAQHSLTMWWLWKSQNMLMRATTKFSVLMFNVTMFKCTSGAKCQSALDLFMANHRKMKGQCLPKRNHSVSKVQFWPPEHWCRLEKSAWTSSTA